MPIDTPHGFEEQATGCAGASSYKDFAKEHGYGHIEVVDWTSSAGDWVFIVSKNGQDWHVLSQHNRYPYPGFIHQISDSLPLHGTAEEVLEQLTVMQG